MSVRQSFLILTIAFLNSFFPAQSFAETDKKSTFYNGHNLTITSYVLETGRCAIGLDILACGVANDFSVGTSTWMFQDYNMGSLAVRKKINENNYLSAFQVTYFETLNKDRVNRDHTYQMQALWTQFVKTFSIEDHYKLHLNFHTNYYFNEDMPFSMRRPNKSSTPWQFNLSSLHEVNLTGDWYILGEMGLIDFHRSPIIIHGGASIGIVSENVSVRFGFSLSGTPRGLFNTARADYQQYLRAERASYADKENLSSWSIESDYAIHPEFSLFYVF